MTITPCGPPKPRKAVLGGRFVLAIRPTKRQAGRAYAFSAWSIERSMIEVERSAKAPPLLSKSMARASTRPSSSKATRHLLRYACRLPVTSMSTDLL